ncbi:MarR family winged helix-turn-helix transcriptional regulator [Salipaludibacillus daqingensis]|uniref:MarR family winged helix-turn-helix transcriptional regulator n=1 Tax=Salipaludibacillus daqingensis TaxID=3041001 RepID=UPI00247523E2|nr:MarR family transcriptional regulator [Salipaludibacillus daqingensis]
MDEKIEKFVGYHMGNVTHFIHNHHNRNLSEYGVTRAQAKVLYLLNHYGDSLQSELQKRLFIQASTMNGIIESLLKSQLIKKTDSVLDRRTKVISLTDKGKQLEDRLWEEVKALDRNLMDGFSEEEQRLLISWLKKMQTNLENIQRGDGQSSDAKKDGDVS